MTEPNKKQFRVRAWHVAVFAAAAWAVLSYCGRMLGSMADQEGSKGVELKEKPAPPPAPAKKPRRNRKH